MSPLRSLLGQTAVYGVSSIVGRVMNFFVLTPFYTRIFTRGEYGVVTELYAYVAFLLVILTYGMETAFFRFASKAEEQRERMIIFSTAAISILTTSSLFLLFVITGQNSISEVLGYSSRPEFIVLFGWIIAIDTLVTIPFARLRLEGKAFQFAGINLLSIAVNIGLNLFFFLYCPNALENGNSFVTEFYKPEFGIGYVFVANLGGSVTKLIFLLPTLVGIRFGFSFRLFKTLLPYSLPLLFLGLAGIVNETFDRAAFEWLSGLPTEEAESELGIYGACYKVAMLLSIGIQAYRFAAEPFIFSLAKNERTEKIQGDVMKYYFIIALGISMAIICFDDIALLLIGERFREGAGVIPILLGAYICFGAVFNLSFWYKLNDKTLFGAFIAFIGAITTISLNVWLVPKIGYHGSAWATLAAYLVMMVVSYLLMRRFHPIKYELGPIFIYITLATFLTFLYTFIAPESSLKYLFAALVLLVFGGFVIIREKKQLKKYLHGKS